MSKKDFLTKPEKPGKNYIMSIASTKKVVTKGKSNVSQGQWVAMATTRAAVEIKNNNQYKPRRFLFTSMKKFCAKIGQETINKNRILIL
jgi:hypothetical protein